MRAVWLNRQSLASASAVSPAKLQLDLFVVAFDLVLDRELGMRWDGDAPREHLDPGGLTALYRVRESAQS